MAPRKLSPSRRQLGQIVDRLLAGGRVSLLHEGHDDLLEERRLTVRGDLVHAEMARLDAVAKEAGGEAGDHQRVFVVERVAAHRAAGDEAVALELGDDLVGQSGGGRELVAREAHRASGRGRGSRSVCAGRERDSSAPIGVGGRLGRQRQLRLGVGTGSGSGVDALVVRARPARSRAAPSRRSLITLSGRKFSFCWVRIQRSRSMSGS